MCCRVFIRIEIVGHNIHAESASDLDRAAAYSSGSDDAERLAAQFETAQPGLREVTAACALHRLDQIAGDGQEQGEGMLRHGRIAIIGYVRHRDAVRLAPVQIDMIVSGRPGCDQL